MTDRNAHTQAIEIAADVLERGWMQPQHGWARVSCVRAADDTVMAYMANLLSSPEVVEAIARYLAGEEADDINGDWRGWHAFGGKAKDIYVIIRPMLAARDARIAELSLEVKDLRNEADALVKHIECLEDEIMGPHSEQIRRLGWWNSMKTKIENYRRMCRLIDVTESKS